MGTDAVALDAALLHGPAEAAKYASFTVSGALLPRSFTAGRLALLRDT
jgi:hypothetical protein